MSTNMPGESQRPPDQNGRPNSDGIPRLTKAQRRVLQAIVTRIYDGRATTIENICRDLELKSTGGVHEHREKLVDLKILKRTRHKAGIELEAAWKDPERLADLHIEVPEPKSRRNRNLLEPPSSAGERESKSLIDMPVLGSAAAGSPLFVEATGWSDNVEQIIPLPEGVVGDADYLVHVKGDSMIGAGILDGDVVFIRAQNSAEGGEIVLAVLPGEEQQGSVTIKRLVYRKGRPNLEPENPHEEALSGTDAEILGKVVGVIHWYERAPWRHRSRTRH